MVATVAAAPSALQVHHHPVIPVLRFLCKSFSKRDFLLFLLLLFVVVVVLLLPLRPHTHCAPSSTPPQHPTLTHSPHLSRFMVVR